MNSKRLSVKSIAVTGVMAALTFAALRVSFLVPLGPGVEPTRIHIGNGVILLAGMLLGGVRGGLAAGIGAFLFDVTDPIYVSSALNSLVTRFLMAWICGVISHSKSKNGSSFGFNLAGALTGSVLYMALYLIRKFFEALTLQQGYVKILQYVFSGGFNFAPSDFASAYAITATAAITSSINAIFGVAISAAACTVLKKALVRANVTI